MNGEEKQFSSPQEEVQYWKELALEYKQRLLIIMKIQTTPTEMTKGRWGFLKQNVLENYVVLFFW